MLNKSYSSLMEDAAKVDIGLLTPEARKKFLGYLDDISIKAARENFYYYVRLVAPERIRGTFKDGLHIKLISKELNILYQNIVSNSDTGRKVMVQLAPESMKSELSTIMFPSWCIGRDPTFRVIAVAHGGKHAGKHLGKPTKDLIKSDVYQRIFPRVRLDPESKANEHWNTTEGGGYFALGVGSQLPGKRGNLIITDDVMSEQTAFSKLERNTINNWVGVGLETRLLEGKSGQLCVGTSWHLDDIAGYLEKRDKNSDHPWKLLKFPAVLTKEALALYAEFDPNLDFTKYYIGGSYWPEHKPINRLLEKKATLPAHHWAASYQQNPVTEEGSIFKAAHFEKWLAPELPPCRTIFVVWDTAFTEEERKDAARSAYTVWGVFDTPEIGSKSKKENKVGSLMLLGCEAGYWSYPQLLDKCHFLKNLYGSDLDFFLIEKKASGISLIQDLQQRGYPIVEFNPDKSKEARAWSAVGILEAGRIWVNPDRQFTKDFMLEVLAFPYGDLKDITDTFVMAVLFMRNQMVLIPQEYTSYQSEYEDDDNVVAFRKPKTYWAST